MDKFLAVRTAVINTIRDEFSRLRQVKAHGGPFNLSELDRFTLRAPNALVAWVGTSVSQDQTRVANGASTFAVYIICRDRLRDPAPDQAMRWAEKITTLIDGNNFGLSFIGAATVKSTVNAYDSSQDIEGAAISEVRFECPMILENTNETGGEPEDEIYLDDRREIEIYKSVFATPSVGSFEPNRQLELIHTVVATVKTLGGLSEIEKVALTTSNSTHEFAIPYKNLGIDTTFVVKVGVDLLQVKDVENVNEANRTLILRCAYLGGEDKRMN